MRIMHYALALVILLATALTLQQSAWAAQQERSGIITNDAGRGAPAGVYLNPQLRYQGNTETDTSRLRTQRIKQDMSGMLVADFNGDGRNEIAILGEHDVSIWSWAGAGQPMQEIGRHKISMTNETFSFRYMDLDRDGSQDLVICTYDDDNRPYTYFLSFKGNQFREVCRRSPYFLSVAKIPPYYTPTLIGMGWDSVRLFAPGVRIAERKGDTYGLGGKLDLPKEATCFNFNYIPASRSNPRPMLVLLTQEEKLKLYTNNNSLIHTTMERYSGSAVGMDHYKAMPGMGVDKSNQMPSKYYAPMNLITADIGNIGEPVVLVNMPVSTASQLFDRYRYFPQSEIHALFWDGVGLGLKWKTRRIRGSAAAVELADVDNNGVLDLVVGLNTAPELGVGSRQCMIVAYPLDVNAMDPNTPPDMSDFEVNPNY